MLSVPDDARVTPPARWELYRLLGDASRLRLMALVAEEELAIGELAELLGEVQPTVSRHVALLRRAGVLGVRRQGTWTLVRLAARAGEDPVLADALRTGRALCERDGSLGRVAGVLQARERSTLEFFARPGRSGAQAGPPGELAAYLTAVAPLLPRRSLAVDVGTGDGRLLEVLAPLYERVVAVDRSAAQLAIAAERIALRGFSNVELVEGEIDGSAVLKAVRQRARQGADAVFAARVLHHVPRPAEMVKAVAAMVRPGGALVVIEYERHEDEALRSQQADLWLGFEASELRRFARAAGLVDVHVVKVPSPWCGAGPDRHLPWQVMTARASDPTTAHATPPASNPASPAAGARRHHGARR